MAATPPQERDLTLWRTRLDVSAAALRALTADVPASERARADRFQFDRDRTRYLASQARLRRLLAQEVGGTPSDVPIVTAPGGKPGLAHGDLRFSLARSAGLALIALSWTTEVGVDLEAIRRDRDMAGVAARFFSRAEQDALARRPEAERVAAAYGCWTRKEAYAKVTGMGLSFELAGAEVGIGGAGPVRIGPWVVRDVAAVPGFAAAVAGAWPPTSALQAAPRDLDAADR